MTFVELLLVAIFHVPYHSKVRGR